MSLQELESIQVGKETTWGTGVTDTAKLMQFKELSLQPIVNGEIFPDIRASLQPGFVAAVKSIEGAAKGSFNAVYEDINYLLESMFGNVTPSGAGPYTRNGVAPTTSIAPRIHTLFHGDATGTYKLLGALVNQLTLTGGSGAPLMGSVGFRGQRVIAGTLAALSDRTVNPIMGDQCTVYVDAWGGTIGTTALSNMNYSFELAFKQNITLARYLGSLYPTNYFIRRMAPSDATLKLSLEFNATSKAYVDEVIVGTLHQRQIRVKYINGAPLLMQFDFAGVAEKFNSLWDYETGVAKVDMEYSGMYCPALANFFKYSNINSVSALP